MLGIQPGAADMGGKRRIDVMLSSTFFDLVEHREAVLNVMNGLQLTPLAQEFDAALPDSDLIKASLDKVDAADVYIGLIGSRYGQRPVCPVRNPDNLSLSELEFRRAVERGLPRCMFIMGANHPLTRADLDRSIAEGSDSHDRRVAFIKAAKADRITAEFNSKDHLKAQAERSMGALCHLLRDAEGGAGQPANRQPPGPDDDIPTAPPAFHYVRKPYIEKQGFAGRAAELALIDTWSTGPDAMLLFQAIGGMGKSLLTWHWVRTRSTSVRGDWAGLLWYSFYEQGADLNDFCVHALAYIREQPPSAFRQRRTIDLGTELRRELDARPWLLMLDGLERVLVAYNRAGKEHMTDEEAAVARDGMGLDREPRSCFRPEDDEVLAMLAQSACGKLLASSRLTPTALTNDAHLPIRGVQHVALEGLASEDAEQVLVTAGVRGDSWRMRRFLQDKIGGHPLSVGVVAGQVMTYVKARGDFDSWVEDPRGGADPDLLVKDLRGRQNHILARAFEDLDDAARLLLASLAMANVALTHDVLALLNPMRPIEPKKVDPPEIWSNDDLYFRTKDHEIDKAYLAWSAAVTAKARAAAQDALNTLHERNFAERKQAHDFYLAARVALEPDIAAADAWLVRTLPELEARGLLRYDADTSTLDMHPAIRHTALLGLTPDVRSDTGSRVSDALSSRAIKPFAEARTLDDLALGISRVEALNAAGKVDEAWDLLRGSELDDALIRLVHGHELLELMQPCFPRGWEQGPLGLTRDHEDEAVNLAALALAYVGKKRQALALYTGLVKKQVEKGTPQATTLGSLATTLWQLDQRASADRLFKLALRLADTEDDKTELLRQRASHAFVQTSAGRLDEAETILAPLRDNSDVKDAEREAQIIAYDLRHAFHSGRITQESAAGILARTRELGQRYYERTVLFTIADWHQTNNRHDDALDAFGDLIALENEAGSPRLLRFEVFRAVSLVALGRRDEAMRVAVKGDRSKNAVHVPLAVLWLSLGDPVKARGHAIAGYTEAWGEGPPYHDHWELEKCRKVLAALGEPEPPLLPFDPAKVSPFDFEPEIERFIETRRAEKAKKAAEENGITTISPQLPSWLDSPSGSKELPPVAREPSANTSPVALAAIGAAPTKRYGGGKRWIALLAVIAALAAALASPDVQVRVRELLQSFLG